MTNNGSLNVFKIPTIKTAPIQSCSWRFQKTESNSLIFTEGY